MPVLGCWELHPKKSSAGRLEATCADRPPYWLLDGYRSSLDHKLGSWHQSWVATHLYSNTGFTNPLATCTNWFSTGRQATAG